ncbi:MAG: biotin--[acetyl-CoA-carboxylase] ligase [Oscillospiraceae bacterium]
MKETNKKNIMKYINETDFFDDIILYDTVTSTNVVAKEFGVKGAKNGTVIISNQQTAGKGRLDRKFFSPPNSGIYMSIVLRLNLPINSVLLITSAAAVAVYRAIKKVLNIETQIKWVNDIYFNGKKLCGILAESSLNSKGVDFIVLGIGLNLNNQDFPENIKNIVASLTTDKKNELIAEILNQIYIIKDDLIKKDFINEYKMHSCIIGKDINIIDKTGTKPAKAIDINENGHLVVLYDDKTIDTLSTGEISIRLRNMAD